MAHAAASPAVHELSTEAPTDNLVRLNDHSFTDQSRPFLGLGISYFNALRDAKFNPALLAENLAAISSNGFDYIRILSMVSWDGLEMAPVTFTNRAGKVVEAWPDYWPKFRQLIQTAGDHNLRVEVTIFADAQYVMPAKPIRLAHMDDLVQNLAGLEDRILHLEVANEAWQNGFPGRQGAADLREFTTYLAKRTTLLIALSSPLDISTEGILALYRDSGADLATVHFSRSTLIPEKGWGPVRDPYRVGRHPALPPVTSNEPIGPGSSVNSESDPVRLCSAAIFAYLSGLPGYVFHSRTGIYGYEKCCPPSGQALRFANSPAINAFQQISKLLPADLPNWTRHDGLEPAAPFTVSSHKQPNRYWPDVPGATNGCTACIGAIKGNQFISLPIGILPGGLSLEARRALSFEVFNILTGVTITNATLQRGQTFLLPQGQGACLIKGQSL